MKNTPSAKAAGIRILPGYTTKNGKRRLVRPRISPQMAELRKKQRAEQERNNPVFADKFLSALLKKHPGQIAVMKKSKVLGIYPSLLEARAAGDRHYPSGVYSVHLIEAPPGVMEISGFVLCPSK